MSARVLIVEDSLTVRMDLVEGLEGAGFDVVPCGSLREAREAVASSHFDVVILDVILPDGDGVSLLDELRDEPATAGAGFLVLSTETEVGDRIRALRRGADGYVGKPYERARLVARARELVAGRDPAAARPAPILVIDDSPTWRREVEVALTGAGYRVVTAASGEDGVRLAEVHRPAAVVVDGQLPGIDGASVVRRIRLDPELRGTPCLLLTASEERGAELRALDAGADAFVRKTDSVDLVLAKLRALLRGSRPDAPGPVSAGGRTVLCVDDSTTYLETLSATLREDSHEVVTARSGEEALELLAVQRVDCIVLDVGMPGLDGFETCRRIKAAPSLRDVPLVLLTAREERGAVLEGLAAGADDYISKSSAPDVLRARVRAQLRRKKLEDETRRVRDDLLRREIEAAEAKATRDLADAQARMVVELEAKNEELERARDEATHLSQVKSRFLASMSHELRTPLNAIIGFSQLLHEEQVAGPLSPKQKEFLGYIATSGRHLLQLINDILDLSSVEAGRLSLRPSVIDVPELVDDVGETLQPLAMKGGVTLAMQVHPSLPRLRADPVRLRQILFNLLSNGIKFTPAGGAVTLRVEREGARALFEVADTGVGIAEADQGRLFREFERLDGGDRIEGTGLGLALTRRLVELHGGTIEVHSAAGRGSTFLVALPVPDEEGGRGG